MATPPLHLKPNADVAERVLLPGDPGRALRLAQHLLAAPMQVLNTNRGLWGYTGTATDGAPLTIQSTGMGGPSTAIVAEELIGLGARRLVRVGTCGGLDGKRALGELLVAGAALCADGASRALGAGERAEADPELTAALERVAGDAVLVASADLFYDPDPERAPGWVAAGAVAVEMEAATLFTVARLRGATAGCILIVSDLVPERHPHRRRRAARGRAAARRGGASPRSRTSCAAGSLRLRLRLGGRGLLVDREALLLARRRRRPGVERRGERAELGAELGEVVLDRAEALLGTAERRLVERLEALVEAIDAVLDALEPLRDRPQPPGQALDVGRGRDVQRAHRRLLRLHGPLAGAEGARDRGVDDRVLEQVLRELADRVLARARELVADALAVGHRNLAFHG